MAFAPPRAGSALPWHQKNAPNGRFFGAAGRARTDTVSLPRDFKSLASANSTTAACYVIKLIVPNRLIFKARDFKNRVPAKRRSIFGGKGAAAEPPCPLCLRNGLHGGACDDARLPIPPQRRMIQFVCPPPSVKHEAGAETVTQGT